MKAGKEIIEELLSEDLSIEGGKLVESPPKKEFSEEWVDFLYRKGRDLGHNDFSQERETPLEDWEEFAVLEGEYGERSSREVFSILEAKFFFEEWLKFQPFVIQDKLDYNQISSDCIASWGVDAEEIPSFIDLYLASIDAKWSTGDRRKPDIEALKCLLLFPGKLEIGEETLAKISSDYTEVKSILESEIPISSIDFVVWLREFFSVPPSVAAEIALLPMREGIIATCLWEQAKYVRLGYEGDYRKFFWDEFLPKFSGNIILCILVILKKNHQDVERNIELLSYLVEEEIRSSEEIFERAIGIAILKYGDPKWEPFPFQKIKTWDEGICFSYFYKTKKRRNKKILEKIFGKNLESYDLFVESYLNSVKKQKGCSFSSAFSPIERTKKDILEFLCSWVVDNPTMPSRKGGYWGMMNPMPSGGYHEYLVSVRRLFIATIEKSITKDRIEVIFGEKLEGIRGFFCFLQQCLKKNPSYRTNRILSDLISLVRQIAENQNLEGFGYSAEITCGGQAEPTAFEVEEYKGEKIFWGLYPQKEAKSFNSSMEEAKWTIDVHLGEKPRETWGAVLGGNKPGPKPWDAVLGTKKGQLPQKSSTKNTEIIVASDFSNEEEDDDIDFNVEILG